MPHRNTKQEIAMGQRSNTTTTVDQTGQQTKAKSVQGRNDGGPIRQTHTQERKIHEIID